MYVAVRRYKIKEGSLGEIAQRAQQGFVPLVSQIPGFVAYYGVDLPITDTHLSAT